MSSKILDEPQLRNKRFVFEDRLHAGRLLSVKLEKYVDRHDVQILAIPAGGVPVGYEVARNLNLPLDLIVVRKIQIPWNPEAGFGALSWDGTTVLNIPLVRRLDLSSETIDRSISLARENVQHRLRKFRGARPFPILEDKTVLLVDDGLASGFTMLVAAKSTKGYKPERIIVAVPTASLNSVELVAPNVDELICLNIRSGPIFAVADAYQRWHDLTDKEVKEWLNKTA
ncbi:MAG: phosphoribosyltransferase [Candidatus Bathyarchaeota archaeon]|nr:MAG: phosphoribosyltransferase [Candidatus Bathyarchaeota archaeon]